MWTTCPPLLFLPAQRCTVLGIWTWFGFELFLTLPLPDYIALGLGLPNMLPLPAMFPGIGLYDCVTVFAFPDLPWLFLTIECFSLPLSAYSILLVGTLLTISYCLAIIKDSNLTMTVSCIWVLLYLPHLAVPSGQLCRVTPCISEAVLSDLWAPSFLLQIRLLQVSSLLSVTHLHFVWHFFHQTLQGF